MSNEKQQALDKANERAKHRRRAFYDAESDAFAEGIPGFRNEEPNVRVYGRAIAAVLAEAQNGLDRAGAAALRSFVKDEMSGWGAPIAETESKPEDLSGVNSVVRGDPDARLKTLGELTSEQGIPFVPAPCRCAEHSEPHMHLGAPDDKVASFRRSASALLDRAFTAMTRESFAKLLGHIAEEGQRLGKVGDTAHKPCTCSKSTHPHIHICLDDLTDQQQGVAAQKRAKAAGVQDVVVDRPHDPMKGATVTAPEKIAEPAAPAYSVEERRVRAQVAAKLSAILDPSGKTGFGGDGLEQALDEVSRRLGEASARTMDVQHRLGMLIPACRDQVRDAALENAATAAADMLASSASHLDIPDAIRALKSKPAPDCLTPGCEKPTGHVGPHEPCGAKRAPKTIDFTESRGLYSKPVPKGPEVVAQGVTFEGGEVKPAPQPSGNPGELPQRKSVRRLGKCPTCGEDILHTAGCRMGEVENPFQSEPLHDFGWALARMREGKRVRRAEWEKRGFWLAIEGRMMRGQDGTNAWCGGDSLVATDWQVAE